LADLLQAHKLRGKTITLVALDGYRATLTAADYENSPAILATRLEGRPMEVTAKGPFILLWPHKEVLGLTGKMRLSDWIWSVSEIRAQ
jgi:hypothetical protein